MLFRKQFRNLVSASALGLCLSLGTAAAADVGAYPDRPVKMVVPFGPGSTPDVVTRDLAMRLSAKLGQNFIVENIAGASGMVGTQAVARAPANGYTLLAGTIGILAVNQFLFDKIPYDIEKDFVPVSLFTKNPNVLAVPASSPYKSVADLIQAAKNSKDSLNYGSSGNGTSLHLAAEMLKSVAQIPAAHIPYTQGVMLDLAAGRIDFVFYHISGTLPLVDSNKARILAIATPERFELLPDVPTLKEAGLGDFDVSGWMAIMAPAGTPEPIVKKLSEAIAEATSDAAWREQLTKQGVVVVGSNPEELQQFIDAERTKWGTLIREQGIQIKD